MMRAYVSTVPMRAVPGAAPRSQGVVVAVVASGLRLGPCPFAVARGVCERCARLREPALRAWGALRGQEEAAAEALGEAAP